MFGYWSPVSTGFLEEPTVQRWTLSRPQAMDRVCLAHGDEESQMAFEDMAGPERFFYDKTTYTGRQGDRLEERTATGVRDVDVDEQVTS